MDSLSAVCSPYLFVEHEYIAVETCCQFAVYGAYDRIFLVVRGLPARPPSLSEQETGSLLRSYKKVVLVALRNEL
jgi:hypothetical protein